VRPLEELPPEVQAELEAFRRHLMRHRETFDADCRFCQKRPFPPAAATPTEPRHE
jgi:hypothetical protein